MCVCVWWEWRAEWRIGEGGAEKQFISDSRTLRCGRDVMGVRTGQKAYVLLSCDPLDQ